MVNQWGREGQVSPNGAGTSVLITVGVVCLLLGSAAGYGGARYFAMVPNSGAVSQSDNAQGQLASSENQPGKAADALPGIGKTQEAPAVSENKGGQTYCEDIQRQLTTIGTEARKYAVENVELKSKLGSKTVQYECPSQQPLIDFVSQLRARVSQLETDLPGYEQATKQARAELQTALSERDSLKQTLDALRSNIAGRQADSDGELGTLRDRLKRSESEVSRLEAQLSETQRLLQDVTSSRDKVKQALDEATRQASEQLSARDATIAQLKSEADAIRQQLDKATRDGTLLDARFKSEKEALTKALEDANRKLAAAQATPSQPMEPKAAEPAKSGSNIEPRDRILVENALARAPGLKVLSGSQRETVRDALLNGACVTDTLEQVFTRVPVLTLRSLIRDLDSPC